MGGGGSGKFAVPSVFLIIHDEEFNFLTPFFLTFNILDRCDFPEKIKENGQKLTKWWHFCRNFLGIFWEKRKFCKNKEARQTRKINENRLL